MYQNPHYSSPEENAQAYINEAVLIFTTKLTKSVHRYWQLAGREGSYYSQEYNNNPHEQIAVLSQLYKRGRKNNVLKHYDFIQFANAIYNHRGTRWNFQKPKAIGGERHHYWRRPEWYLSRSGESSFVKQPHHQKKVLSDKEQARRDWREKKRFRKDKSKGGSWYSSPPNWFVKDVCLNRRSKARQALRDGRYNDIPTKPLPKNAKWLWW